MNTIDKLYLTIALMLAIPFTEARAQGMMDVHSHNIPPYYVDMLELHDAALEETFPLPAWDIAAHLRFMDSAGIGCTVLSMPAPQPYFGDSQESAAIIRRYNEDCARLKAEHPGRFKFCASLPLPDVEAALREAVYALDTLGGRRHQAGDKQPRTVFGRQGA